MGDLAKKVAVVGAGWAGCSAAVELALQGHSVELLEASRTLGGRARGPPSREDGGTVAQWDASLDNGQHMLLGAYTESLRLMRLVGVDIESTLLRLPLQMCYPPGSDGISFVAARLPAPLHLLAALWRAHGLARIDRVALARFTTTARWIDWRLNQDCSVSQLLEQFGQTARVTELLWRPLCLAALNTPPTQASAQVFLNVLRDSLGARRAASDMLLPKVDLGRLFPAPAARFIDARGGRVRLGLRVTALSREGHLWRLKSAAGDNGDSLAFDAVILATPVAETCRLLADWQTGFEPSPAVEYEPIVTCYLQYPPSLRLARPFFALRDDPAIGHWGQFVFDRGQLDSAQAGVLAVVVSAASGAVCLERKILSEAIARQLANVFGDPAFATPQNVKLIAEKRATFACKPYLVRPGGLTQWAGLIRAGDYLDGPYPATLEAAVRSGIAAARLVDGA
ncbi:MAG: hydroxysqualene dehydroxylase HpnE [Burkholderiaceae bacterium]